MKKPSKDEEIVEYLLSNNAEFEEFFFQRQCAPLLGKIRWSIFDNEIEIDEITNEFLILLKSNNWYKLRSFKFRCTLFGWLKIVALNHFISIKEHLLPNKNKDIQKHDIIVIDEGYESGIEMLINRITVPMYKEIMFRKYINKMPESDIIKLLKVTNELYINLYKKANKQLIHLIKNEGEEFERLYIQTALKSNFSITKPQTEDDEHTLLTHRIDAQVLINSLTNERYRLVLHSLIIKKRTKVDVAKELGISLEYVDILKHRAIKQITHNINKEKEKYGRY